MTHKRIRSRLFPLEWQRFSKEEQHAYVGRVLAEGYRELTGTALTSIAGAPTDPPDLLFAWRRLTVGAELFELEQFYPARALLGNLTNLIYQEFERRGLGDRYEGVAISMPVLASLTTERDIKAKWRRAGIRTGTAQAARELVDLVSSEVASRDALPDTDFGLTIRVDPATRPALACVATVVACSRCVIHDVRRTDGRAAPLVIASPGYTYNDPEMVRSLAQALRRKVAQKARLTSQTGWKCVDHSILVAHDYPRWRMNELVGVKWAGYLKLAAKEAGVLDSYDELWLVGMGSRLLEWEAVQIAGAVASPCA